MKKILFTLMALATLASTAAFAKAEKKQQKLKIGIAKIVQHPALDQIEKGIQDRLNELGIEAEYNLGKNAEAGVVARRADNIHTGTRVVQGRQYARKARHKVKAVERDQDRHNDDDRHIDREEHADRAGNLMGDLLIIQLDSKPLTFQYSVAIVVVICIIVVADYYVAVIIAKSCFSK